MCRVVFLAVNYALIQLMMYSPLAQSSEITYELVNGSKYRVCVEYTKYLNSVHADDPMYCDRKISSGINGFAEPVWREVEEKKRVPLYKKSLEILFGTEYMSEQQRNEMIKRIDTAVERNISNGSVSIMHATFDLNNDHKREDVINVIQNDIPCVSHGMITGGVGDVYGIDENGELNRRLFPLQGPSDVFFFDGRTFLDWWGGGDMFDGIIVFEPNSASTGEMFTSEICRIRVKY